MGNIRKIGEEYYIEFHARGLLYQQKAGKDLNLARKMLEEVEGKIQKGEMDTIVRNVEWDIFFQIFLEDKSSEFSPRTYRRYQSLIKHFTEFLRSGFPTVNFLSEITPRLIEQYQQALLSLKNHGRPLKLKTVHFTLYILRDVLDYAIKLGYLNDNPTIHVRIKHVQRNQPETLSAEELNCLFQKMPKDLGLIVMLMTHSGMTINEIIRLEWKDVDFKEKCLNIPSVPSEIRRRVPISDQVVCQLSNTFKNRMRDEDNVFFDEKGGALNPENLLEELHKVLESCRIISRRPFAVFRHTFAKDLLQKGVSIFALNRLLGFDDIAKVMRYSCFISQQRME